MAIAHTGTRGSGSCHSRRQPGSSTHAPMLAEGHPFDRNEDRSPAPDSGKVKYHQHGLPQLGDGSDGTAHDTVEQDKTAACPARSSAFRQQQGRSESAANTDPNSHSLGMNLPSMYSMHVRRAVRELDPNRQRMFTPDHPALSEES